MEATGLAHGPVIARKERNASGAKGPWAVAGAPRPPARALRPAAGCGNALPADPAPAFYPDAAKAARSSGAGRQNRPARGGRSVERYLRNGFSRILVWVPARAQPASSAGRALYGTADEKGELGARC